MVSDGRRRIVGAAQQSLGGARGAGRGRSRDSRFEKNGNVAAALARAQQNDFPDRGRGEHQRRLALTPLRRPARVRGYREPFRAPSCELTGLRSAGRASDTRVTHTRALALADI
ncbi:hypothetical protein SKAU_G00382230 [Synaphobranchus kaupii]|uniref:Uncharacterized protein n=1 Tax=Synaphobranchus kaupii TaxID=118154 RepID=A0A9Q1ICR5_SYNKA|nr:hypothetical protein SKAU_G00382230 [Synaphobranchus kaupii]